MIRVLMIGKTASVMTKMVEAMGKDFDVKFSENNQEALRAYSGLDFDAVILGRAMDEESRKVLRDKLRAENSKLVIVKSLAPIGQLVGEQVKAALFEQTGQPAIIENMRYSSGRLHFSVKNSCEVGIVFYRLNALFQLKIASLMREQLKAGEQSVVIKHGFLGESFVVITVNGNERHVLTIK